MFLKRNKQVLSHLYVSVDGFSPTDSLHPIPSVFCCVADYLIIFLHFTNGKTFQCKTMKGSRFVAHSSGIKVLPSSQRQDSTQC